MASIRFRFGIPSFSHELIGHITNLLSSTSRKCTFVFILLILINHDAMQTEICEKKNPSSKPNYGPLKFPFK